MTATSRWVASGLSRIDEGRVGVTIGGSGVDIRAGETEAGDGVAGTGVAVSGTGVRVVVGRTSVGVDGTVVAMAAKVLPNRSKSNVAKVKVITRCSVSHLALLLARRIIGGPWSPPEKARERALALPLLGFQPPLACKRAGGEPRWREIRSPCGN